MEIEPNPLQGLPLREGYPGNTPDELAALEDRVGLTIPPRVRQFYSACGGAVFINYIKLLPLSGIEKLVNIFRRVGHPERWGYLPFTDNNDSNHLCVCCQPPLTGYLVLAGKESAEIKFRSIESFWAALKTSLLAGGKGLDDVRSDFEGSDRTDQDIRVARALIELGPSLEDVECRDAYRFATRLLTEQQIDEIIPLLNHDDVDVMKDALWRLTMMKTQSALAAVERHHEELARFVSACGDVLNNAGVRATVVKETQIRLDPGPIWLHVEVFFTRRNNPAVWDYLVERSRFFISRET